MNPIDSQYGSNLFLNTPNFMLDPNHFRKFQETKTSLTNLARDNFNPEGDINWYTIKTRKSLSTPTAIYELEAFSKLKGISLHQILELVKDEDVELVARELKHGEKPIFHISPDSKARFRLNELDIYELDNNGLMKKTKLAKEDFIIKEFSKAQYTRIKFIALRAFDELNQTHKKHQKQQQESEEAEKQITKRLISSEQDTLKDGLIKNRLKILNESQKKEQDKLETRKLKRKQDQIFNEIYYQQESRKIATSKEIARRKDVIKNKDEKKELKLNSIKKQKIKK